MNNTINTSPGRRAFLQGAATTVVGLAAASSVLIPRRSYAVTPPLRFKDIPEPHYLNLPGLGAGRDVKVLNYALALEDLESDLYVQAVMRLTGGGTNKLGHTIPGLNLAAYEPDVAYLTEFTAVEAKHRDFLRGSLNSLIKGIAIRQFKYDFGIENKSREEVLALVLDAEDNGLRAYLGAVPYLKTKLFITAAAAIQGTEARHTTTLTIVQNRLFNGDNAKPVAPLANDNHGIDTPRSPDEALAHVSPFIVK